MLIGKKTVMHTSGIRADAGFPGYRLSAEVSRQRGAFLFPPGHVVFVMGRTGQPGRTTAARSSGGAALANLTVEIVGTGRHLTYFPVNYDLGFHRGGNLIAPHAVLLFPLGADQSVSCVQGSLQPSQALVRNWGDPRFFVAWGSGSDAGGDTVHPVSHGSQIVVAPLVTG